MYNTDGEKCTDANLYIKAKKNTTTTKTKQLWELIFSLSLCVQYIKEEI